MKLHMKMRKKRIEIERKGFPISPRLISWYSGRSGSPTVSYLITCLIISHSDNLSDNLSPRKVPTQVLGMTFSDPKKKLTTAISHQNLENLV